jgi:hypothetical protein
LDYQNTLDFKKNKKIEIKVGNLRLKIMNESFEINKKLTSGVNNISTLNSTINTNYNVMDRLITFESNNSRLHNSKVNYNGRLAINPFDLDLKIDLDNYKISNLFSSNSIINEFIKSELLFNENISINTLINIKSKKRDEIFHEANIKLNILNSKINFDNSVFINNDIGLLKITNSDLSIDNDKLTLNAYLSIDVKDTDKLFSFLNTSKQSRKDINNIKFNIVYDFSSNQIEFKNIKVNNNELNDESLNMIEGLGDINSYNLTKSRRLLNELINLYEG